MIVEATNGGAIVNVASAGGPVLVELIVQEGSERLFLTFDENHAAALALALQAAVAEIQARAVGR